MHIPQPGTPCGDQTETECHGPDYCDENGQCVSNFAPATTECRASAGVCDVAESCTGDSALCPEDGFLSATTECRASAGDCDVAESCTGDSASCPGDGFQSATTECRASAGDCDVAESCTGDSASCPGDGFQSATTECRASAGICDVAESCTGDSASCPDDGFQSATTECRPSADECDPSESCFGDVATCPEDITFDPTMPGCQVVSTCRTPGFYGTHACGMTGTDCEKGSSSNITQKVITGCDGCLSICGESVTNTVVDPVAGSANSAVEATCVSPSGDIRHQLARQLTAASLNCCVSGVGSDCYGLPTWDFVFAACNFDVCEGQLSELYQVCIYALDCLNNGGNLLLDDEVFCQTGTCQNEDPCNDETPCVDLSPCTPLEDTCHTRVLGVCADGSICTEANTTLNWNDKPICDSDGSECKPGPAGSSKACSAAEGDGKGENAGNDCAILPQLSSDECSKFNQGEECCALPDDTTCDGAGL
jgi:hypothetical protein